MELNFHLHPGQLAVFKDRARFKVVAAGRRWGKSRLAAIELITKALQETGRVNGHDVPLRQHEAWYIAPTFDQAKDIIWALLKDLAKDVITKTWENDGKIQLVNNRLIQIKGADRPDRLRGVGLSHVVMDEFADMKPETWETILRPTLADVSGSATFIGTPKRKNHFYDIFMECSAHRTWKSWSFTTKDNPYIPRSEIAIAKATMPSAAFRQEMEASFDEMGDALLTHDLITVPEKDVPDGQTYMAVDLAGFFSETQKRGRQANARHDEHPIATVKVTPDGWYVLDVLAGKWDVRETSVRILREAQKHRPVKVAIERGIAFAAVMPYLEDQMRRLQIYPQVEPVSHGGKDKTSRITWALQGRMEHGRVKFVQGEYLKALTEQIHDFPNGRHDDMVDAIAYIDQISATSYRQEFIEDEWEPLDAAVGL